VRQLATYLGLAVELRDQIGGCALTACLQDTDQVVNHFPSRQTRVGGRVPAGRQLTGTEKTNLAALLRRTPARPQPATLVFLAWESVSATPYSPSAKPECSNHATAQRLSASKSPSCSANTSSKVWLMSASASRTDNGLPSASRTVE